MRRQSALPQPEECRGQTAAVVSEMADTMRVTAHADQVADQLAQAATLAAQEARTARKAAPTPCAPRNRRLRPPRSQRSSRKPPHWRPSTPGKGLNRRRSRAPKAVETAEIAAKAAANAKSTVEQLDQVVAKATHANTPEAWSEGQAGTSPPLHGRAMLSTLHPRALVRCAPYKIRTPGNYSTRVPAVSPRPHGAGIELEKHLSP